MSICSHGSVKLRLTVMLLAGWLVIPSAVAAVKSTDVWIGEVPPGSSVAAGYLVLRNEGRQPMRLTGISSPVASRVEWHDVQHRDGMVTMLPRQSVVLAPGQQRVLGPGDSHLMFTGLTRALPLGERVTLTLSWLDGSRQTVTAIVRPRPLPASPAAMPAHHHHH